LLALCSAVLLVFGGGTSAFDFSGFTTTGLAGAEAFGTEDECAVDGVATFF
jgi:hypothetical protein